MEDAICQIFACSCCLIYDVGFPVLDWISQTIIYCFIYSIIFCGCNISYSLDLFVHLFVWNLLISIISLLHTAMFYLCFCICGRSHRGWPSQNITSVVGINAGLYVGFEYIDFNHLHVNNHKMFCSPRYSKEITSKIWTLK